jgi:hypothetical protein
MSDRILIKFVGGPADGESQWHQGGNYIEVAERPKMTFGSRLPVVEIRKFLYRIDTRPQAGGAYLARVQQ